MKMVYTIMAIVFMMFGILLLGGCGHQPMAPVGVFSQIEHKLVYNYFEAGAIVFTVHPGSPPTKGATSKMDANGLPVVGHSVGNGSVVFAPGAMVDGYSGPRTPSNKQDLKAQ